MKNSALNSEENTNHFNFKTILKKIGFYLLIVLVFLHFKF